MAKKQTSIQISIIIPFLNEAIYLEKCIKSLLSQNFPKHRYEIILVDNGSTDQSVDIIKRFPQVHLYYEKHKGDGAARNTGVRYAKGTYLAFTDADCSVGPNWLNHISNAFKTSSNIVMGDRLFPLKTKSLRLMQAFENYRAQTILTGDPKYYFGYTNNMAVSRDLFKKVGPFKPQYRSYDTEWIARAIQYKQAKINYKKAMQITHLEVTSISVWIKKFYEYGKSYSMMRDNNSKFRVAPDTRTFAIYLSFIKDHHYSPYDALILLTLLIAKAMAFKLGAMRYQR